MSLSILLGLALVFVVIWAITIYNRLIQKRNHYKNAFSQIDVQLKRRYDLIPNLVETAKAYLKHERETLENVIKARNAAAQACQNAARDPSNNQAMHSLMQAETSLGGFLGRLLAVQEAYPDLKADQRMQQLHEELVSIENRVSYARQAYNDFVTEYNNAKEVFPNSMIAGFFQFKEASLFEVSQPVEKEPVRVQF